MEKINIIKILEDCPKGIELYSPLFGKLKFAGISHTLILCQDAYREIVSFESDGKYISKYHNAECMLFPSKENRDWSKFQRPFKNGDIISNGDYIAIFCKLGAPCSCTSSNVVYYYCYYSPRFLYLKKESDFGIGISTEFKYATEEEKEKLFDAIKNNGYKWNSETKTLEKSNNFYAGEVLVSSYGNIVLLSHTSDTEIVYYHCILDPFENFRICEIPSCGIGKASNCILATKEQRDRLFDKLKKSGYKYNPQTNKLEKLIKPNKFNISTLKPFKSEVLVRNCDDDIWAPAFYGKYIEDSTILRYLTTEGYYKCCIPYEGNEYLLGTTNDCDEYYKNW